MTAAAQTEPTGSIATALATAASLLETRPKLAELQAGEILKAAPNHPEALLLLGSACRRQGDLARARAILEPLARTQPRAARAQYEWALTLVALGEAPAAIAAFQRATALKPAMADAWRALGDTFTLTGDPNAADAAYAQHIRASVNDPRLLAAAAALCDNDLPVAERLLRAHLRQHPTDVAAIRMLAEAGTRLGRYADAENLLTRCLELAPSFIGARHNYAVVLYRQNKAAAALPHIERLLAHDPRDPSYRNLQAACLATTGDYARAIAAYEGVLAGHPNQPKTWLGYGHALKTAGRRDDAVRAYRRATTMAPELGEAYWSLANLKTVPFAAEEIAAMRALLARSDLSPEDRFHLHYALGRALEDGADYAASFDHYAQGAKLRRAEIAYDSNQTTAQIARTKALFTPALFADRAGAGCPSPDPIFIVGLPRAGSTLIEQILSSHSEVEGTMELPELANMARELGRRAPYPEILADLPPADLAALGDRFLERTRAYRKTARPFFIDKMPNNFIHAGLIQLILPNARIIDARRHPMANCFSAFKQHFARGQHYTYDLQELGRYYRDYVDLMAHFDAILPGRIHRVVYEDMVAEPEGEIRRLLDHCGLAFQPACLSFHETDRAVRTASSEQVRRPIFREGLAQWRHYEPWLDPLRQALAPSLKMIQENRSQLKINLVK